MTNELLVVTAGRHARLEAVLKTALQGVPFRRYDMAVSYTHLDVYKRQELAHAQEFLELLCKWNRGGLENLTISAGYPYVLGTVAENLKAAQAGEWEEHSDVYPAFAAAAEREGFADAARLWRGIAVAEGCLLYTSRCV